ncbi:carboxypeptidase-like regulatory domain-containing protein [Flavobacterium sp. SUN046]|uniref:carboxypeptidase-like regulatory domain-containing protein n=1 Tax=Flavobacterium sp. SUN046 TaxID=3002440 RepID=UPI002DBDB5C7|nr:carboxypeptidase-like regulatory domain-containing protein [Flavobacterium sp. SUN046]MEC4049505.1 carboxypeptidase-like regulatory domain-containing protein [Flavobacterium sp. SUN046]
MNSIQDKKLSMFLLIINIVSGIDVTVLALLPGFSAMFAKLQLNVSLLHQGLGKQATIISGVALNKSLIKKLLIATTISVSERLVALATNTKDVVLKEETRITSSELSKISNNNCYTECKMIYDYAQENKVALEAYGVTDDILLAFEGYLSSFDSLIPAPKREEDEKKMATSEIASLFAETDLIVEDMDAVIKVVSDSHPELVSQYFLARKIGKPGYRVLAATVRVMDVNGNPLGKVLVSCPALPLKRTTTAKGNLLIRTSPEGVYKLNFSKPGFKSESHEVSFVKGNRVELNVELEALINL